MSFILYIVGYMYVYTVLVVHVPTVCTTNFPTEELEIIDIGTKTPTAQLPHHSQQKKKNFSAQQQKRTTFP